MFMREPILGFEAIWWVVSSKVRLNRYPVVIFHIAIENDHLIDLIVDFPMKPGDFP